MDTQTDMRGGYIKISIARWDFGRIPSPGVNCRSTTMELYLRIKKAFGKAGDQKVNQLFLSK